MIIITITVFLLSFGIHLFKRHTLTVFLVVLENFMIFICRTIDTTLQIRQQRSYGNKCISIRKIRRTLPNSTENMKQYICNTDRFEGFLGTSRLFISIFITFTSSCATIISFLFYYPLR